MRIFLNNFKRMVAALSLGLAVFLFQIPLASAAPVFFDYTGSSGNNSASGFIKLEQSLLSTPSAALSITQSDIDDFSFTFTFLNDASIFDTATWTFANMAAFPTTTFIFDTTVFLSLGIADVVGAVGTAASGPGELLFDPVSVPGDPGTGFVKTQFGTLLSSEGDWQIRAIPLPAALPLYGTGLAVMGLLGWRRKRKAAARA